MRIEAQSKYLQLILERAEASLACQTITQAELKSVRSDVDDLVLDVRNECFVSSFRKLPITPYPALSPEDKH
jgi:hypothetical protein